MKYLLVLALCLTSAMVVMSQNCQSDDDCDEDKCCVQQLLGTNCQNRKKESDRCVILDNKDYKKHLFTCPCVKGFDCVNQKEMDVLGLKVGYDPRCVKSTTTDGPVSEGPETVST